MFEDLVSDQTHEVSRHAEDYTLFKLADFTDHNGEITSEPTPVPLANAHEVKAILAATGDKNQLPLQLSETSIPTGAQLKEAK